MSLSSFSSTLPCHCKQLIMPLSYSITSFFFLSPSLMILVMAPSWKLRLSQIPQCNSAFIFQLSNPRSSLSPLFGESAPKAKSLSQFTSQPSRHYFALAAMILLSLKFIPYITIKDAIPLAAKNRIHRACKQTRTCALAVYFYVFIHLFTLLHFGRSGDSKGTDAR